MTITFLNLTVGLSWNAIFTGLVKGLAVKHQLAGGIRWIVSKPATLRILLAALQTLLCRWDITNDVGDGADALASNPTNRFYCRKKKTMSPEAITEAQVARLRTTYLEGLFQGAFYWNWNPCKREMVLLLFFHISLGVNLGFLVMHCIVKVSSPLEYGSWASERFS